MVAHSRMSGRGVTSGLEVNLEVYVLHELAGGKIVRIRPYADLDDAQAAVG